MTEERPASALRDALDNSQSLLTMLHLIDGDAATWKHEGVEALLKDQIAKNRAALSAPQPAGGEAGNVKEALVLAEDVLSRAPFSNDIWPNGMHPNKGINIIRAALKVASAPTPQPAEAGAVATSAEWLKHPDFAGITVTDPDGWDRKNFQKSWDEKITRAEFEKRLQISTCLRALPQPSALPGREEIARALWNAERSATAYLFDKYAARGFQADTSETQSMLDKTLLQADAILALLARPVTPSEGAWQPIETHDGSNSSALVVDEGFVSEAYFRPDEKQWWLANTAPGDFDHTDAIFPTHWQPLPTPPKAEG